MAKEISFISDELRALVMTLKASGYRNREIALQCRMSESEVNRVIRDPLVLRDYRIQGIVKEVKETMSSKAYLKANEVLDSIDEESIAEAKLKDRVVAFGVLSEKARLLEDKSTANVAVLVGAMKVLDSEEERLEKKIIELERELSHG